MAISSAAKAKQRPPMAQRRTDRAGPHGEHQQRDGGQECPPEHHHRRREVLDGDLDEEVRDAPDHSHQPEQEPAAPRHGG